MLMADYTGDVGNMDEDLAVLGLAPLTESRPARKNGSVPLTEQDNGESDEDEDEDEEDEDEDEDEDEEDEKEESVQASGAIDENAELDIYDMVALAEEWEVPTAAFLDFLNEAFGLDCAKFLTEDEIHEIAEEDEEDEDEDEDEESASKMEAAIAVLGSFYNSVEQVQEGADDQITRDNLIGVIEAYEYTFGALVEGVDDALAARSLEEAKKGFRRMKALLRRGKRKFMKSSAGKNLKRAVKKMHARGMHLVGGVKMRAGQFMRHLRGMLKGAHGKMKRIWRERIAGARNSAVTSDVEPQTENSLSELVQSLSALRHQVAETDSVSSAADELMEGLSSIHGVATSYFTRIAKEVSESENVGEDDPRVAIGRQLESIADDAARVAASLEEGNYALEDYADDLASLSADLDDTIEAMKSVD